MHKESFLIDHTSRLFLNALLISPVVYLLIKVSGLPA